MNKATWHGRIWLAAPAAVVVTLLGLTVPAQAQPAQAQPAPPARPTTAVAAYRQAVKSGDWVHTPYGLSYKTCVYRAPNHAVVSDSKIVAPSGAVQRITPCTHPTLRYPGSAEPTAGKVAPDSGPCAFGPGGDYWAASCYGSAPAWVTSFDQEYAVPSDPAKDGALIFLWGGLEDANGDTLLQDVLTWGANGTIVTNPNIWYVTPWYLWPGNNSVIGPSIHVEPVDTIVADLTASKCSSSGGACTWVLKSTDTNSGKTTSLTVGSDATFDLLLGSVMEVPSADGCVETPTGGHAAFRHLTVGGNDGTITPDFGSSTPDPQCSVSITQTSSAADILWKP
jgi:hypothetical protein